MKLSSKLIEKGFLKPEDIRELTADDLIDLHHLFMRHYNCWIKPEEFNSLPIPTILALLQRINDDNKNPEPQPVILIGIAKGVIK